MNIIKNNINKVLFGIFTITLLTSCENDGYADYKTELTPSVELNGEWYIDISNSTGLLYEHTHHYTYDSNKGDNTMFFDSKGAGKSLKGLVNVDNKNYTFTSNASENLLRPVAKFTVTEGKILKGAAHSRAGNVTDSIYLKVEFSNEPGITYTYSGHKRTGFLEDNY